MNFALHEALTKGHTMKLRKSATEEQEEAQVVSAEADLVEAALQRAVARLLAEPSSPPVPPAPRASCAGARPPISDGGVRHSSPSPAEVRADHLPPLPAEVLQTTSGAGLHHRAEGVGRGAFRAHRSLIQQVEYPLREDFMRARGIFSLMSAPTYTYPKPTCKGDL